MSLDTFKTKSQFESGGKRYTFYSLPRLASAGFGRIPKIPYSLRILLENLLRREDGRIVTKDQIGKLAAWDPLHPVPEEILFAPSRVLMQDFTGVPAVCDLAAMRDQCAAMGGDPDRINPSTPADLVIDHSVQVDFYGTPGALKANEELEYQRNLERYRFLRWGQKAFRNFRVVPPGTGIIHQVNLEYLASLVMTLKAGDSTELFPDTLVGTDSHTTMINGLGVLGWGVGGIEAEAAMLGQPVPMRVPEVVGVKLIGKLRAGVTSTDLVLTVTEILRKKGVVGKFVEFFGPGLDVLSLSDRATIANMAPEYGATIGFFPVDRETLKYLELSGRDPGLIKLIESYYTAQGLFRGPSSLDPEYSDEVLLDLSKVEASLAGPKRPQDRVPLAEVRESFQKNLPALLKRNDPFPKEVKMTRGKETWSLCDGSVVLAAITSCTNTSNPEGMMTAGLVARKALKRGLRAKPWVKTSLAPGSQVVTEYLQRSGLLKDLEACGFFNVGYGCTTCIGNSGPLDPAVEKAIREEDLVVASVLSGNRNFEGRIHPLIRANYLASPALVVIYALAGGMGIDLQKDALGMDQKGQAVYFKDLWPSPSEISEALGCVNREMFVARYRDVFCGDNAWNAMDFPAGGTFCWDEKSTYIKKPPFFGNIRTLPSPVDDIQEARILLWLGDSVTTDHISPAGAIAEDSPAGQYLLRSGVEKKDFNSYGARRGNHEVMVRGTFANSRIKNLMIPGTEGGMALHLPSGKTMSVYEAAERYREENTALVVVAGKEYGTGSSRDWAAKGPALLGVRAVIAESFERIHRSNLVGMGILPLQFKPGQTASSLGITGREVLSFPEMIRSLVPGGTVRCLMRTHDTEKEIVLAVRIDTASELEYFRCGGILPYVLRQKMISQES